MNNSALARRRSRLARRWPTVAGLLFAGGLTIALWIGFAGTGEAAQVLTAAGFVYLGAAALGRRDAAWPLFAITFIAIGIGFAIPAFDPMIALLTVAAALTIYGLIRGRLRPPWGLPLQAAAVLLIALIAGVAALLPQPWAGLLVGGGLLAHAAWDIHHHRTARVVTASLAEFCAALDITLALAVMGFAFAALADHSA